ncbi:MAG: hypothetical protein LBD73_08760 [Deferribacteraceae bacterium]|jgi:hypothetical protein|nr:hypothetical protein [Deferribacteraceae bacterium]
MPKEPTLDELRAIRAKREPFAENPTEEDIAIMKADIDEYRKRYEANTVCELSNAQMSCEQLLELILAQIK